MGKFIDLTGRRFGRLLVLEKAGRNDSLQILWRCRCDCGKETITRGLTLRNGETKSCGCLFEESRKAGFHVIHGGSKERLYNIWRAMRSRCNNPNNWKYSDYGGRGIRVCSEWNKYPVFRQWAMTHGYENSLSIDRIDVDGNYEPDNCRWADDKTQANNKRSRRNKCK